MLIELLDNGGNSRKTLRGTLKLQALIEPSQGSKSLLNATFERSILKLHLNDALVDRAHAEVTAFHT
jgi:hypothetical protein